LLHVGQVTHSALSFMLTLVQTKLAKAVHTHMKYMPNDAVRCVNHSGSSRYCVPNHRLKEANSAG
jgi:hypothetical protein